MTSQWKKHLGRSFSPLSSVLWQLVMLRLSVRTTTVDIWKRTLPLCFSLCFPAYPILLIYGLFALDVISLWCWGTNCGWREGVKFYRRSSLTNSHYADVLCCWWLLHLIQLRNQQEFLLSARDCWSQTGKMQEADRKTTNNFSLCRQEELS